MTVSLKARHAAAALCAVLVAALAFVSVHATAQDTQTGLEFGQEPPLLTVYGREAPTREGDHDHRQVIYLSVPEGHDERIYVRIFDPDAGGRYDTIFGNSWPIEGDTRTRFAIFGGPGAYVPQVSDTGAPDAAELTAGTLLAEEVFDVDKTVDGQWRTIALLDPAKGEAVGDRRVFRLLVEGLSGDDGNLFTVALSSEVGRNTAIDGARITSPIPTLRVPDDDAVIELSFTLPGDAERLIVGNFDASFGTVTFTSKFRSVAVEASGQDQWSVENLDLREDELGTRVALTFSGGREIPNDLTVYVKTTGGELVAANLPPRRLVANRRPVIVRRVTPLDCTAFTFDAAGSQDPDGEALSYLWRFGDGETQTGMTVTHAYPAPGTYKARLEVTDTSGHLGDGRAEDFTVTVREIPVAVARAKAVVSAGVPVVFDGTASNGNGWPVGEYIWTFEDGTVRRGATVEHVFAEPGIKTVKLRIVDTSGHPCDTADTEISLRVNDRPVASAGDDRRAAIGEVVQLDAGASTDSDGTITDYRWDLGDGTVLHGPRIEHAYKAAGTYAVTLTVTDDAGVENSTASDSLAIAVNDPPVARAGDDRIIAAGDTVRFDARDSTDSDGHIVEYVWDFGDGGKATGLQVEHVFPQPGVYTVTLTVRDGAGVANSVTTDSLQVVVNAVPLAQAGPDHRVSVGDSIAFDAGASSDPEGKLSAYRWDFGDGTVKDGITVSHAYSKPGAYRVRLQVTDTAGVANSTDTDEALVLVNAPPVADAGSDIDAVIGEIIQFDSTASMDKDGAITRYDWTFGDGGTATGPRPTHAYHHKGEYRVELTVTDDSGTSTRTATTALTVRITDAPNKRPVAEAGPDIRVIVGEYITFDGTRSFDPDGSIIAHEWNFGDGSKREGPTPLYAYRKAGEYSVSLRVRDNSGLGNDTHSDHLTVYVDEPPNTVPVAVAGPDVDAAIAEPITFDAGGSADPDGNILKFAWDFGDGATAQGVTAEHAYEKSGLYKVVLTVTDDAQARTGVTQDVRFILINEPPVAKAGPDQLVTASAVQFDGSGSIDADGNIALYEWDFGDGTTGTGRIPVHVYREPGVYDVTLVVTDDSGTIRNTSTDTMRVVVNTPPIADAGPDLTGEPGETLVFQGDSSIDPDGTVVRWVWDFNDGATATGEIVEHAFEKPGTYFVRLMVQDDTGHENAIDFAEAVVVINAPPTADAGADVRVAPGDEVTLSGTNSFDPDGELIDYRWDFSDTDEPLNGETVTRTFENPGVYKAQLTVIDDSGVNNGIANDEVTISINHEPVAAAGPNVVTADLRVVFDASESADADGDGLTFTWNFGDGRTATGARVAHTYTGGGVYPVILTVDDGTGLKNATDQDSLIVKINRPPVAVAGVSRHVCTNDVVVFDGSASSDPEGGVLRYSWNFGDGGTSDIVNPTRTFEKPATYAVTLTVEDDSGLPNAKHSDRVIVRVDQAPAANAGPDRLACVNNKVQFDGTKSIDVDGVVNRFTWDFGDGNNGGGDRPSHVYRLPGKYRVLLNIEGDQSAQCDNVSTDEAWIRVIEAPVARIEALSAVPAGTPARFDGSTSSFSEGEVTAWHWDFGDGNMAEGAMVEHTFKEPGTYRVALTIDSDAEIPDCRSITSYHLVTVNAPPVAVAGEDLEVSVNQDALFDGSASQDPDGGIVSYVWDFGDGETGTGMQVHHKYKAAGRYKVLLTVTDNTDLANNSARSEVWVTVKDPPGPPIEGPVAACVNAPVDWKVGDEEILDNTKFTWLLGDGARADTASVAHTYRKPGWYNVTLFVDDGSVISQSRRHSTRVLHVNQPPDAEAGPDKLVCPATPVTFDATGSSDPDGKIAQYVWDFGDGNTATGARVDHIFAKPGTYDVKVTVTDDSGSQCASATDTVRVVVNAPPVADAGPDVETWAGGANDVLLLDGSRSHDPDRQALNFLWQLGDRATLTGEKAKHVFTSPGEVDVTLTVNDPTGLACGTATDTMRVIVRGRN